MRWQFCTAPLALAVLVTLANAAKPVTVDDTAYLLLARHIASKPADPYGFSLFWSREPEPAMEILAPPVVPYWLALGMKLFGEHVAALKVWLFPFVWLLAWALRSLLVRFARGTEHLTLPLLMLSPAVLPTVNLMLDVPAVALALASVELFIRACVGRNASRSPRSSVAGLCEAGPGSQTPATERSWRFAVLAGVVAALAMQTKYSAFVAPAVIAWFGITHRRFALVALAVGVCVALFVGWELLLVWKYGQSHFAFHASASGGGGLRAFVNSKFELIPPLASYLGCLAVGAGLLSASVLRVSRWWLAGVGGVWCLGFALTATLPRHWTMLNANVSATTAFWEISGAVWFVASAACAVLLLFRGRPGRLTHAGLRGWIRTNAASVFLVGWFVIEVVAALGLTPFPAARRVIGVTLVMGLLAARGASRVGRAQEARKAPRWIFAVGIAAGVLVAALDTLDAFPEKVCAEGAAEIARDRPAGATVWYSGHWGFQFYCDREGMKPVIAKQTVVRAGDYVVLPVYPPGDGFPRPYAGLDIAGSEVKHPPPWVADVVGEVLCDDRLSAKTVPNFYGGIDPVSGRDAPRLRVRVYRLKTDWFVR